MKRCVASPPNNLHELMPKKLIPNNRTALKRFAPDIVQDSARRSHGFDHPPSGGRADGGWRPGFPSGWLRHQLNAANTHIKPWSVKDKETQGNNKKTMEKITREMFKIFMGLMMLGMLMCIYIYM